MCSPGRGRPIASSGVEHLSLSAGLGCQQSFRGSSTWQSSDAAKSAPDLHASSHETARRPPVAMVRRCVTPQRSVTSSATRTARTGCHLSHGREGRAVICHTDGKDGLSSVTRTGKDGRSCAARTGKNGLASVSVVKIQLCGLFRYPGWERKYWGKASLNSHGGCVLLTNDLCHLIQITIANF